MKKCFANNNDSRIIKMLYIKIESGRVVNNE